MTQTSLSNFGIVQEQKEAEKYWCEACLEISKHKHNPEFCDK